MARQLPKAYLRIDPNIDTHPDPEAMLLLVVWANRQPRRGRFRDLAVMRRVIGAKRLQAALERGDLVPCDEGHYLAGWDEWQEGDVTVGERVSRIRERRDGQRAPEPPSNTDADLRDSSRYTTVSEPLLERYPPSEALGRKGVGRKGVEAKAGRPALSASESEPPIDSGSGSLREVPLPFGAGHLRRECLDLLERGKAAVAALGVAWNQEAELRAASRTARTGDTLDLAALQPGTERGSPAWIQATRDRLRTRVAELEAAALAAGTAASAGRDAATLPEPDPAAAALWERVATRLRDDTPEHVWRLWIAPTAGVKATDRLLVAVPSAAWLSHGPGFAERVVVAAAAEGHPVVGVDWVVAPDLIQGLIGAPASTTPAPDTRGAA